MSLERVLLTGSSGLIGTSVVRRLKQRQISTICLRRERPDGKGASHEESAAVWDPYAAVPWIRPQVLAGVKAAVHMSGASLAGRRWTSAYKREITASRIEPTRALARILAGLRAKPDVLVCASAIGIYGDRGDVELSEA